MVPVPPHLAAERLDGEEGSELAGAFEVFRGWATALDSTGLPLAQHERLGLFDVRRSSGNGQASDRMAP